VPKRFANIGIRIEDDVIVTAQGSRGAHQRRAQATRIEAIEAAMARRKG
jgi:Xaa-Pro aminopeptidase